ncbi:mu-type opioid receptor-like isoform X2 [Mya arenaria]|uniref:mu-type opioid receptor-like isoform X2 n=1 Tax=Mya arenaria TaxID=6604 RepID=UPI0022E0487E|nr:mu-type opioid receptor-like isoform X2 [Mya arenaria]
MARAIANMTLIDGNTSSIMPLNLTDTSVMFNISEADAGFDLRPWNTLEKAIFGTWLTISMMSSLIGNLLVIIVVLRHKGMQTRTNMFLVNLAIADFLTGLLLAPFSLTTLIKDKWIFGETMCNVNGFFNSVCLITSIHTMMYISIHKYVSITRPFSRILNHWKILIMCLAAWLWSITCAVLTLFILSHVEEKPGAMQCGPEYPKTKMHYLHHVIITGSNIVIPLAVMLFAYARMYWEFRKHAMRLRQNTTLQSDQILGQQIQVTKTLFMVLACFFICWIPYAVYSSYVSSIKNKNEILVWTNPLAYCFMYMNSGCNPIIYGWRSNSFREGYKQILCQHTNYVVSDDTIRDADSPSIVRRLTTLLHHSFKNSRHSLRKSSENSSLTSIYRCHSPLVSSPTHTLLRRATSKTAKGSSIIRKDGSIIITKNGKIISVRRDIDRMKRDKSFNGFDDLRIKPAKEVSRSLSEINMLTKERIELMKLRKSDDSINSSFLSPPVVQNGFSFGHSSLSKIDSVDETESDPYAKRNKDKPHTSDKSQYHQDCTDMMHVSQTDSTAPLLDPSPSVVSQSSDNVFIEASTKPGSHHSQDCLINNTPFEVTLRDKQYLSKSACCLDSETNAKEEKDEHVSKSTDVIFRVPLLRCPSIERLDSPMCIPRCSSEAVVAINNLQTRSPLYIRRWRSNKNVVNTRINLK